MRYLFANQNNKGSSQKTLWRGSTSSRKVWWLNNSGSQSSQCLCIHLPQSPVRCRVQDLATQWIQNKSFTGDGEEVITILGTVASTESDIRWILVKYVKNYHGITALQHLIDPRRTASLIEPSDEWSRAHQQYCYSQDKMKGGGQILWNAVVLFEMSTTSWKMGKRHMKDDLERQSKGQ